MGVWLLEQLVRIDFELLSVSYIISELFLLSFDMLLQEQAKLPATPETRKAAPASQSPLCPVRLENAKTDAQIKSIDIQCAYLAAQLPTLTATERTVYDLYCSGKSSKEILALLHIKENTLKFHNKNIYSKLGVSSRKQLLLIASALKMKADPAQGIANDAG
ncbi:MAG: helix-turn-helix domain-containing protein [Clostridia bacterium]|nr:helix-turn-helix domain-containing protein [Clostridia bacterium]